MHWQRYSEVPKLLLSSDQESLRERCAHIQKARAWDGVARRRSVEFVGSELGREGFGIEPVGKVASPRHERHAKVTVGDAPIRVYPRSTSTADAAI